MLATGILVHGGTACDRQAMSRIDEEEEIVVTGCWCSIAAVCVETGESPAMQRHRPGVSRRAGLRTWQRPIESLPGPRTATPPTSAP